MKRHLWCSTLFEFASATFFVASALAQSPDTPRRGITANGYAALRQATLIPAGRSEIDGHRVTCGSASTILDPRYRDFGGAYPGFIVLNPRLFAGLDVAVKLWIFSHECAHQSVGPDEVKADCVAVQRGRREGWLTPAGLAKVCAFMRPARADTLHFGGVERCTLMRRCFARQKGAVDRAAATP